MFTNIPVTWGSKHKELLYQTAPFKDKDQENQWLHSGHKIDSVSVDLHQMKQPYDWMTYLLQYFEQLDHISFCFSKFKPGQYFPMHRDLYGVFRQKFNISDISTIWRYVIFLEDSEPGHILQVEDKIYHQWKKGDSIGWSGSTAHLAANLGVVDRYTLQITGVLKPV